ncbi:hypothetical protein CC1G_02053 [Coprinopsis cinerea okayama7|uniref:YCII-related domain-containing protein n=1 Tax=Coprinopsis cinerea (strain Okayama-7 / 130 / ATCC MYA-4618 / FGSC 9003) TaxID=240176 RepID=A8N6E9_COPC7|nr:hypothetical protein CC1G_02053 [Coprinopsis cinerea okayama7\|eukprot:XP_001830417.1 hypothetical protein CC1G_02053 [Coprinopsis cinerea okayama7\
MASELATSPPNVDLKTFFVYAPDGKGEGALEKRYSVRPQHLAAMQPLLASKVVRFGGILLDDKNQPTEEDPRLRIIGSTMIVEAESIDKVREIVESDIYYKTGVWDKENIVITPFIPATPLP